MRTIACCLAFLIAGSAAADCAKVVEERLLTEHSRAEVDRICPAATALVSRGVLLHTHSSFVNDLARAALPISVQLPDSGLTVGLTESVYCGAGSNEHHGTFLAVARSALLAASPGSAISTADCPSTLDTVAKRLAASSDDPDSWAIAAKLDVQWTPWSLTTRITAADGRTPAGSPPAQWQAMKSALMSKPVQTTEVDAIEFARASDNSRIIKLAGVFYFESDSIAIAAALPEDLTGVTAAADAPSFAVLGSPRAGSTGNVTIRMSYDALNALAARLMAFGEISIQLAPPIASGMLRTLQVEGGVDRFKPFGAGSAVVLSETLGLSGTMEMDGRPLSIRRITVTSAKPEYQWVGDIMARGLTKKFEGHPWNPLSQDQVVPFPWGGAMLALKGQVTEVVATADALVVQSQLSLSRQSTQ